MSPRLPWAAGALSLAALMLGGCQVESVRPSAHADVVVGTPWHRHDYIYYPGVQVYFHVYSGTYWYRDRGHWHHASRLPPRFVILPRERVRLRAEHGEPWHHAERYRHLERDAHRYDRRRLREYDREERARNRRLYRDHDHD